MYFHNDLNIYVHTNDFFFFRPFKRTLSMLTKMFGNFWTNVVLVVNFWSFKDIHAQEREGRGVTTKSYARELKNVSAISTSTN